MKFVVTIIVFSCLLGCGSFKIGEPLQLSQGGRLVRAIDVSDTSNCKSISRTEDDPYFNFHIWWGYFVPSFETRLNDIATAGGDSYTIVSIKHKGKSSQLEAWNCGWNLGNSTLIGKSVSGLQEISAAERRQCGFIRTIAEGDAWSLSVSRNFERAKNRALNIVKEAGGDSYYTVMENTSSHVDAGLIIEAWRCN